tara:strand:- start:235 stop:663 length:429 start_codon:yes stop_codon:yes gene_type:complete
MTKYFKIESTHRHGCTETVFWENDETDQSVEEEISWRQASIVIEVEEDGHTLESLQKQTTVSDSFEISFDTDNFVVMEKEAQGSTYQRYTNFTGISEEELNVLIDEKGDLFSCGFTDTGSEYKILGTAKVTEVTSDWVSNGL